MTNVLITGVRAPIGLDLARSFAAAGWTPYLVDSIRPWSTRWAGMAQERVRRIAPPRFAFKAFAADLARLVEELQPALIVPMCEDVFYVAEAAVRLGFADKVFAPPPPVLRVLHSKVEFAALAGHCGLAAPTTRRVTSREALQAWRPGADQLVFKPEFSRFASHALVRPDARKLDRIAPTPDAPWAVQDFVAGEELCLWSAAVRGEIVAFAAYRPIWRLGRSASFYFEADRDPALLEIAQRIARETGASGQLSFDVIRRSDGAIAPIECNPRGVSGLHLFDGEPRLAQAIMTGDGREQPSVAVRHLEAAMWLLGLPQAVFEGRVGAFRRDLGRSRDVFAGQPGAALGALLDAGRFTMVGLSRGRSPSGQSTDDIEWNGEPIG